MLLRIQKVIAKVVGPNELKRLSMRDNFLYAYILKNGYKITNLPKIEGKNHQIQFYASIGLQLSDQIVKKENKILNFTKRPRNI